MSVVVVAFESAAQSIDTIESYFNNPPEISKPIIIWQWMDGLVTEESITHDLEAFKEAGLGGVQNFQIGSTAQGLIGDPNVSIGSDRWKTLMRWAMQECARLGLSFGTHNCPGWSSSAYTTVTPEDSMQKLVWTATPVMPGCEVILPQPETNLGWYRDIAVLAVPCDGVVALSDIIDLTGTMLEDGTLPVCKLPEGSWTVYRFGHTTNMKTNGSTAPESGIGLECDKFSREAIQRFWESYPRMLLNIAGEYAGSTFTRIEIDSYEAGPQDWTPLMKQEFASRRGYDLTPWLVALAGRTVKDEAATASFRKDWEETLTDLFAEVYYAEMGRLVRQVPGMNLLIEPYHGPIDTDKICRVSGDALWCCEFWTKPANWGDGSSDTMSAMVRKYGKRLLFAEGFTCIPSYAWQDDPAILKVTADHQYCLGINSMTLHAYGSNPWTWVKPGMNFAQWGTQFTPYQTWWEAGGAKALYSYMARCAAVLQHSDVFCDMKDEHSTLHLLSDGSKVEWLHKRTDDGSDIFFVTNTSDTIDRVRLLLEVGGRIPEIWDARRGTVSDCGTWSTDGTNTEVTLEMDPHGSAFVVFRKEVQGNSSNVARERVIEDRYVLPQDWTISFPQGWGAPEYIGKQKLGSWTESEVDGVRYFSGTATYHQQIIIPRKFLKGKGYHYVLELGEVKNLARVRINGQEAGEILWTPPFNVCVDGLLRPGTNVVEIEVTNLWPNRMIGDEQEPDDVVWEDKGSHADGSTVGAYMAEIPDWLRNNTPRPSSGRYTISSFKHFGADHPLFPAGLLGPEITIIKTK